MQKDHRILVHYNLDIHFLDLLWIMSLGVFGILARSIGVVVGRR